MKSVPSNLNGDIIKNWASIEGDKFKAEELYPNFFKDLSDFIMDTVQSFF